MKKLSRSLCVILCFAMCLSLLPVRVVAAGEPSAPAAGDSAETEEELLPGGGSTSNNAALVDIASGTCGTNLTWKLTDAGLLTISGSGTMSSYSSSNQPWYSYRDSIKKVTVSSGVTSVGSYAFYGLTGVTTFTINSSVTSIGDRAFSGCTSFTSITLPSNLTKIGSYAFYNCTGLTLITIPAKVTSFGNYAFGNCTAMTKATINSGVTSIGSYAFYNCTKLATVTIPTSVTSIGSGAFYNCSLLSSATIPYGVTQIGPEAFYGCVKLTPLTLPNSLTTIGIRAFQNCSGVTSLTIPESVKSIGASAFYGCTGLTSVTLPASVTSVGSGAFGNCTALTSIGVTSGNTAYVSTNGVLFSKNKDKLICYPAGKTGTSYSVPSTVTALDGYAFDHCSKLTSIMLPSGLTVVGSDAFYYCTGLTSLTIPEGVSSLGDYSCSNCTALQTVTLPLSLKTVDYCAFYYCSKLAHVYYAGSAVDRQLINIKNSNERLKNATWHYAGDLPSGECGAGLTWALTEDGTLTVSGSGAMTDFESAADAPWYQYRTVIKSVVIEGGATSIGTNAFDGCTAMTSVSIPGSVTAVGSGAFNGCSALSDVYYTGNLVQWNNMEKGENNDALLAAELHAEGCTHPEESIVVDPAVAPTCEETGLTEGSHCSVCSEILKAQEIVPATGHDWDEGVVTTEPTCTTPGVKTFTCKNDSTHTYTEEIPAVAHTAVTDPAVAPTCEETGLTEGSRCSICGEILVPQEIVPATGHDWDEGVVTTEPTCTEPGVKTFTCKNDSTHTKTEEIQATGHDWDEGVVTTEPTCTEPGVRTFTCKKDHTHTKTEKIQATGHNPVVDPAVAPTYDETGLTEGSHCSVCGEVLVPQEVVPKLSRGLILSETGLTLVAGKKAAVRAELDGADVTAAAGWSARDEWSVRAGESVVAVGSGTVVAMSVGASSVTVTYSDSSVLLPVLVQFADVADDGQYFYEPVYWAAREGITSGKTPTTFEPYSSCTRGQIVTFLWKAMGSPEPATLNNPFSDVKTTDYFYKPVMWAYHSGVTAGKTATTFGPYQPCTREQAMTFMWRAAGKPSASVGTKFKDVKKDAYYAEAVYWARDNKITTGQTTTSFGVGNKCTRGQIVTFLQRYANLGR